MVAQRQRHPGVHYPRPRGDESQGFWRRADLRCRRSRAGRQRPRAAGPDLPHARNGANFPTHAARGGPPRARDEPQHPERLESRRADGDCRRMRPRRSSGPRARSEGPAKFEQKLPVAQEPRRVLPRLVRRGLSSPKPSRPQKVFATLAVDQPVPNRSPIRPRRPPTARRTAFWVSDGKEPGRRAVRQSRSGCRTRFDQPVAVDQVVSPAGRATARASA